MWQRLTSARAATAVLVLAIIIGELAVPGRQLTFHGSPRITVVNHGLAYLQLNPAFGWSSRNYSALVVSGTLRNDGPSRSDLVRVVVTMLDGRGNGISTAIGFPSVWSIPSGGQAPFIVPSFADPRITTYRVEVEEAQWALTLHPRDEARASGRR